MFDKLMLIVVNLIILCLLLACASGFLFELKSEVTSLRKEVSTQDLEIFELKTRLSVFEKVHVAIDFVDKSSYIQVIGVTECEGIEVKGEETNDSN